MKIMVDADACPVKELIIQCAKKHELDVIMVCDVAHMLFYNEDFVSTVTVDQGFDSADLAIATSGTSVAPWAFYGLAALLFCTGLANLVEYLKEEDDG